ncbi:MAG: hypothetical protein V9H69_18605 [Anaerolineae bacterium]
MPIVIVSPLMDTLLAATYPELYADGLTIASTIDNTGHSLRSIRGNHRLVTINLKALSTFLQTSSDKLGLAILMTCKYSEQPWLKSFFLWPCFVNLVR